MGLIAASGFYAQSNTLLLCPAASLSEQRDMLTDFNSQCKLRKEYDVRRGNNRRWQEKPRHTWKISFMDIAFRVIDDICNELKNTVNEEMSVLRPELLVVDCIQNILAGTRRTKSEWGKCVKTLADLAGCYNASLIIASHTILPYKRWLTKDYRPRMEDICLPATAIELADVTILLHYEDGYHRGDPDYTSTGMMDAFVYHKGNPEEQHIQFPFE